ncbi:MAG TPA: hypothetical protein ENN51_03705 [candidate division WOR-3 bacterium]|uniref:Uncharacterized protein n=1 Tax=candidate division WOR-3 bacterium TaxID=2052148 RepID=A0A7V0T568_UNCW3|nr:hypothetical protein [candidate division WOR-3 bacterium]
MKWKDTVTGAVLFVLVAAGVTNGNLLTNGDFEQPLTVGWEQDVSHVAGSHRFERSDTLGQPTPGYAAKVFKQLAYHAALGQQVEVPGANLTLTFDARMAIVGGSTTCWPTGAFIVSYLNADGDELGTTMFILRDQYNTWRESDTLKLHDIDLPSVWNSYELDIAQEIADNLPGVDPAAVRRIEVKLYSYVNGT